MGRTVAFMSEGAARVVFYRFEWLWDLGFWLFAGPAPTREADAAADHAVRLARPAAADREPRSRRDRVRLSERDRGARAAQALRAAARFPSSRRSPISRRCTTGRAAASTCTSSRTPSRSPRCARSSARTRRCTACTASRCRSSTSRARRQTPRARARAAGDAARSCSSRAAAGASATCEGAVEEALAIADVRADRLPLRPERRRCGSSSRRGSRASERVRVEGFTDSHARLAGGRRRARALDRRPDRARGADARLPGDLVRLGPRSRAGEQRGLPPLRPRRRRRLAAGAARRDRARARHGRTSTDSFDRLPSAASFVLAAADAR